MNLQPLLQDHAYTACAESATEYAGRRCCRPFEASFVACQASLVERCSTLEEVCARKSAIVKQVLPRDMQGERLARMAAESRRTPRGRIMYAWTCTACPVSNSFTVPLIRYTSWNIMLQSRSFVMASTRMQGGKGSPMAHCTRSLNASSETP